MTLIQSACILSSQHASCPVRTHLLLLAVLIQDHIVLGQQPDVHDLRRGGQGAHDERVDSQVLHGLAQPLNLHSSIMYELMLHDIGLCLKVAARHDASTPAKPLVIRNKTHI